MRDYGFDLVGLENLVADTIDDSHHFSKVTVVDVDKVIDGRYIITVELTRIKKSLQLVNKTTGKIDKVIGTLLFNVDLTENLVELTYDRETSEDSVEEFAESIDVSEDSDIFNLLIGNNRY